LGRTAAWSIAVLFVAVAFHAAARAEGVDTARLGQIQISYDPPSNANFQRYYEALKSRRVLERLQSFMAPLRLPNKLTVRTAQCGAETTAYKSGGPVTICYELVQRVAAVAAEHTDDPAERTQILDGTFVEAVLHQLAYALFDQLRVPIWGRKDDAADRLAAYVMTSFDDKVALTTILGTAKFFQYSNHTWTGADFASAESPEAQRFYNYLCIAYGADPITFHFLAPRPGGPRALPRLTRERGARCTRLSPVSVNISEYLQVRHAFDLRIMPYVDPDLLIKVRASEWLLKEETPESPQ
jgi:hypothetical protein